MTSPLSVSAILFASLAVILPMPTEALPAEEEGRSIAVEQLAGTTLTVAPGVPYERATLRIAGPEGYALTKSFDGAALISVDLSADSEPAFMRQAENGRVDDAGTAARSMLHDGQYFYEVVFADGGGGRHVYSGQFLGQGGFAVSHGSARREPTAVRDAPATDRGSAAAPEGAATAVPGVFDEAVFVSDTNGDGETFLSLASTTGDSWIIDNFGGHLLIASSPGDGVSDVTILPDRRVGIGSSSPQRSLHVSNSGVNPQLRLSAGGPSADLWVGDVGLWFRDTENQSIVKLNHSATSNALVVDGGGVGIGTGAPAADLDVRDLDSNGFSAFRLTGLDDTWAVSHNHTTGDMAFNLVSSPGPEIILRDRFHPTATLGVQGAVRATQFKTASSKLRKTAFEAIDPVDVLARLAALPVQAWRYKSEAASARHVGPFAEDFLRLFGLGDGETITTVDADGVLMAAVQGLNRLVEEAQDALAAKDAEIAAIEADVQILKKAIADR